MIKIIDFHPRFHDEATSLVLDIQQNEIAAPVSPEHQPDLKNIEAYYLHRGGNFWLALDNSTVIGTLGLLNAGGGVGVMRKMFVRLPYRGAPHFVAKKLLTGLLYWAKAKNYRDIYLGTLEQLKVARRFYEKNGFRPIPENNLPAQVSNLKLPLDRVYYHFDLTGAENA